MWGWTKHIQTQAFLRLLQSSFQVNMTLMCYLCLCSQRYIVVHVELVDFLEAMTTTRTRRRWLTTQQITKFFLPISPSGAVSDALRIYYTGLPYNLQLL